MTGLRDQLAPWRILPILDGADPVRTEEVALACAEGGLPLAEVLLRAPRAWEAAARLRGRPELRLVGVGTVFDEKDIARAKAEGFDFAISPHLDPGLIAAARTCGLAYVPTAETSTEVAMARAAGSRIIKLFPAQAAGGPERARLYAGVYPDLAFLPSGIGDDLRGWLALGSVAAVGMGRFGAPDATPEAITASIATLRARSREIMEGA